METKFLCAFDILHFSRYAAMMILLRRHLESKLEAEAPKIPKPRPKPTPRHAWQIGRRPTRVFYVLFFQSFVDRPRSSQGAAAELAHYALPNIEKENILEEGLQRRDGELDPLHSVPDRIAFPLAIDVFEETVLFPAEKA
jgi:hypothetical protein